MSKLQLRIRQLILNFGIRPLLLWLVCLIPQLPDFTFIESIIIIQLTNILNFFYNINEYYGKRPK